MADVSRTELEAARAWFPGVDRVPGDKAMTHFKQMLRLRQARWREVRGYPAGHSPYRGGPDASVVGSRLELAFAKQSASNFLTVNAQAMARSRLEHPERHEMINRDRLYADLLSSMPMCFNLFADIACDREASRKTVDALWPDVRPGSVTMRFEYSPGRKDALFLGNQSAFDVALDVELDAAARAVDRAAGQRAIIGIETKFHEHAKVEKRPTGARLLRYLEVTRRSGIFVNDAEERILGTSLQQVWLDHLLVLSMLQHPSKRWQWGRFVLVFPAGNSSFESASAAYRALLRDDRTFQVIHLEDLVACPTLMADETRALFRDRYL
jgi:hypothetical protein